ncbi:MAG TPA: AAA family ATPase, partial [Myxococcota bacterium]
MSRAVDKELSLLLRSGYKLVALESFEEERAVRAAARAAEACEREFHTWSLAGGLDGQGKGAGGFDACMRAIEALEKPALIALLDAHSVIAEPLGLRRLRDALVRLGQRRQTLLLVGPLLELPLELEREAGRVQLPLPSAAELQALFEKVLAGTPNTKAAPELLADCVRAALGLTGNEAVRVFRKAWLARGALDEATVTTIVREKQKALRRTPALSFHDSQDDLSGIGGLGELKRWLRERRRAFSEEARTFGLPAPRGLLLLGVQGCGKSLCAKAVAREWRFPLLRLDLAAAFGDPAKPPELTMREAMAVAESLAPAVLWIDEIEKGFAATDRDPRASRVLGAF